jgi:hypothetical protein
VRLYERFRFCDRPNPCRVRLRLLIGFLVRLARGVTSGAVRADSTLRAIGMTGGQPQGTRRGEGLPSSLRQGHEVRPRQNVGEGVPHQHPSTRE